MSAPTGPKMAAYYCRDVAVVAGFTYIQNKFTDYVLREYAFYVFPRNHMWHYSTPVPGTAARVEIAIPLTAGGYCHTHPAASGPNFSPKDGDEFVRVSRAIPGIVFYLMDNHGELRYATKVGDFPAGRVLTRFNVTR